MDELLTAIKQGEESFRNALNADAIDDAFRNTLEHLLECLQYPWELDEYGRPLSD
jgi:hypothetical protein